MILNDLGEPKSSRESFTVGREAKETGSSTAASADGGRGRQLSHTGPPRGWKGQGASERNTALPAPRF